jgi:hypothetical protein
MKNSGPRLIYAEGDEVVAMQDRNPPVAKLIPFIAEDASVVRHS